MTIREFFDNPIVKFPLQKASDSIGFREFFFGILDEFMNKINSVDLTGITADIPNAEKTRVQNLIDGIKSSINHYLDGHPYLAYDELKKSLDANSIFSYLKNGSYSEGDNFFRIREDDANFSLTKGELFHIPFQKRDNVTTQRYSIPGFPCLYISDSIYLAWEELRRPSLNHIQAVRLKNKTSINFLDLTTEIYLQDSNAYETKSLDELWTHLIAWPLIAACSVKVINREATFKPEYIVPQLLLQIVRVDGKLDGIRFSSTHLNRNPGEVEGEFNNLVIPVKDSSDYGYCKKLTTMFDVTEPVPWEIIDVFCKLHGNFLTSASEYKPKVNFLQLIERQKIGYIFSTFGNLEVALYHMSASPVPLMQK